MSSARKLVIISTMIIVALTVATSAAAGQQAVDQPDDWGDPVFNITDVDNPTDTPLQEGYINYNSEQDTIQFRVDFNNTADIDNNIVQVYIDEDRDQTTGASKELVDDNSVAESYYENLDNIGADYRAQVGGGSTGVFEFTDPGFSIKSTPGTFTNQSRAVIAVDRSEVDVPQEGKFDLKFTYVNSTSIDNTNDFDWAPDPDNSTDESLTFSLAPSAGDGDGGGGLTQTAEVSGTVNVRAGATSFTDGGVTLELTNDNGVVADTETVAFSDENDAGLKNYDLIGDPRNINGQSQVVVTTNDSIPGEYELDRTTVSGIDLSEDETETEDFTLSPPLVSLNLSYTNTTELDARTGDRLQIQANLSNTLNEPIQSANITLRYNNERLTLVKTARDTTDSYPSRFKKFGPFNGSNGDPVLTYNTTNTSGGNLRVTIINDSAPVAKSGGIFNATFKIDDEFSPAYNADLDTEFNMVAEVVNDENKTVSNTTKSNTVTVTQTRANVSIVESSSYVQTKANMIGAEMRVVASATSNNSGEIKNISLINSSSAFSDSPPRVLDSISCGGASCDGTLVHTPQGESDTVGSGFENVLGNDTLASGLFGGNKTYNTTDRFELRVYGAGQGSNEVDVYNLEGTRIYQRGDVSFASDVNTTAGEVGVQDFRYLVDQRGAERVGTRWDTDRSEEAIADIDNNGVVDIRDLTIVASELG